MLLFFFDGGADGGSVGFRSGLPNGDDVARSGDVERGVPLNQEKIGAKTGSDAAAVIEAKGVSGDGGRGAKGVRRRESCMNEEFQFADRPIALLEGTVRREDAPAGPALDW